MGWLTDNNASDDGQEDQCCHAMYQTPESVFVLAGAKSAQQPWSVRAMAAAKISEGYSSGSKLTHDATK